MSSGTLLEGCQWVARLTGSYDDGRVRGASSFAAMALRSFLASTQLLSLPPSMTAPPRKEPRRCATRSARLRVASLLIGQVLRSFVAARRAR